MEAYSPQMQTTYMQVYEIFIDLVIVRLLFYIKTSNNLFWTSKTRFYINNSQTSPKDIRNVFTSSH